jgi:hypothetical protein
MKRVREFSTKVIREEAPALIYQKDTSNPEIPVYPANVARAHLACGFHRTMANDTDDLPGDILVDGVRRMPVVCAPDALGGGFIVGYVDIDKDDLVLCEHPVFDASKAARCAHKMAHDMSIDSYDLIYGEQHAA